MKADLRHGELTRKIIGACYTVYNKLGHGFAEKVHENALMVEHDRAGVGAEQQAPIEVYYDGHLVGEYVADIVVEGKVIVEIKACRALDDSHYAQVLNYLKATGMEVGLLVNFGPEIEYKRCIFTP